MKISKTYNAGIILLALGLICAIAQYLIYGNEVDANGIVPDSLLIPLSFGFGILGILTLLIGLGIKQFKKA